MAAAAERRLTSVNCTPRGNGSYCHTDINAYWPSAHYSRRTGSIYTRAHAHAEEKKGFRRNCEAQPLILIWPQTLYIQANCCRHVIRTLPLTNVFFRKAVFIRHPNLLQGVLRELPRICRCFVLHSVLRWGGGCRGGSRNTGLLPVMLLWSRPVLHPRWCGGMETARAFFSLFLCATCHVTRSADTNNRQLDVMITAQAQNNFVIKRKFYMFCATTKHNRCIITPITP